MSSENTDLCHLITSTKYLKQRTAVLRSYVNGNAHVIVLFIRIESSEHVMKEL